PGAGATGLGGALEAEDVEAAVGRPQHVHVDDGNRDVGQAVCRRRLSTTSMRAESARARNGLVRKSSAPSSKTRTSLSSSPLAVSTMTGTCTVAGRERRCESTP